MDLNELRGQIDEIDSGILSLFSKRMEVCRRVGEYKTEHNLPVMQGGREKEVIERIKAAAPEGLENGTAILFSTIMDISKCLQNMGMPIEKRDPMPFEPKKVKRAVCQGTVGSYSEAACKKLFGDAETSFCHSFEDVFSAVESNTAECGILPLQNSTIGSVSETYDLMAKHDFYINSLIRVEITHCLAAKKGVKAENIRYVYSKEEALSQCSEYLKANGYERREYANTALSAEFVAASERNDIACICSESCAGLYGLEIISDRIADAYPNYTRFISFSKEFEADKNADIISVLISIPHTEGSLYRLLTKFAVNGLNLLKIESKSIAGSNFEVLFYLDFAGNYTDPRVASLLSDLEKELTYFRFLGNFREIM